MIFSRSARARWQKVLDARKWSGTLVRTSSYRWVLLSLRTRVVIFHPSGACSLVGLIRAPRWEGCALTIRAEAIVFM